MTFRELRVTLHLEQDHPVGTLVEQDGAVFFAYDEGFVGAGRSLSPYALPLRLGLHRHAAKPGVPLPGVFGDSRPDGWGLKLLHRAFSASGRPRAAVTAFDELAFLGDRAMGALSYHPTTGPEALFEAVDLGGLAHHAREVYAGAVLDVLPALLRAGGSPGGARPKALIGRSSNGVCLGEGALREGFEPWLVKFERPEDDSEVAQREAVWLALASACGVEVPRHEVLDLGSAGHALATERFDRAPRRHMLSAAGALDVDFRTAWVDYAELGKLALFLSRGSLSQVECLLRRAMFNVVFGNDDDHLKNHAWLFDGHEWRLSPAYDLTWSPLRERSTPVCGHVREVPRKALLQLGTDLGLPASRVKSVLEQVLEVAATTGTVLDAAGCRGEVSRAAARAVEATRRRLL